MALLYLSQSEHGMHSVLHSQRLSRYWSHLSLLPASLSLSVSLFFVAHFSAAKGSPPGTHAAAYDDAAPFSFGGIWNVPSSFMG